MTARGKESALIEITKGANVCSVFSLGKDT